jgi:hypothetical protein
MSGKVDIARALKDKNYFDSLSVEDQERVRGAGGVGESHVSDEDLESASGGLEGGAAQLATTTSSDTGCTQCGGTGTLATIICTC